MGTNCGNNAGNSASSVCQSVETTTFRLKVVEHLSWGAYDPVTQKFVPGHEDNKPVAGRKFRIKMPDGSSVEKITDENGIIEFVEQPPNGKFEVTFEPEDASLNSKYILFYNRVAVVNTEV